jgi:hypothetical protein
LDNHCEKIKSNQASNFAKAILLDQDKEIKVTEVDYLQGID